MNRRILWPAGLLVGLLLICLLGGAFFSGDPARLDPALAGLAPCPAHPFGTDALGRDLFGMIWQGGGISLLVGLLSATVSGGIALVYGSICGLCGGWVDRLLGRLSELLASLPSILLILFLQAFLGQATPLRLALVIGAAGWMPMARLVREEVRARACSDSLLAAKLMNAGFWHLLRRHLLPGLLPTLAFLACSAVGGGIATESALSFLGVGLSPESVSWGGLLAQADRALLTGQWWVILFPGLFLAGTVFLLYELADALRGTARLPCSNLDAGGASDR